MWFNKPAMWNTELNGTDLVEHDKIASRCQGFAKPRAASSGPRLKIRSLPWALLRIVMVIALSSCGNSGGSSPLVPPTKASPTIQHVIVVVGENRSFDAIFATYTPAAGQTVWNLLSEGIINADGTPGPNFVLAAQNQASDTTTYELSPARLGPYPTLPQPNTAFLSLPVGPCAADPELCPDPGLSSANQELLFEGGTGQLPEVPDCRYPTNLPNGSYQITGPYPTAQCQALLPVEPINNTGDPTHRFFQMWQQNDCAIVNATATDPSGCLHDLYAWVDITVGWDVTGPPTTNQDTSQGGVAMGFYNMARGDLPYLQMLAQTYSINDNYHQPFMGGTAVNSTSLGTGDLMFFTDINGNPAVPPSLQIENPNPMPGTNNYYQNDLSSDVTPTVTTDVPYVNCSDPTQPGVAPIMNYLHSLPYPSFNNGNCTANIFYLVNDIDPGYNPDGTQNIAENAIGPQTLPTIGEALSAHGVTWKYYGEGVSEVNAGFPRNVLYCAECNPFQFSKAIMTGPLRSQIQDLSSFYSDVQNNTLPAVSFVKPDGLLDGHPGTSTPPLFEGFLEQLIGAVQGNQKLWSSTVILVTFDESGGEYDSGYIQPIDFFGDGPRTVLIAVSPFSKPGFVDHTYTDHASVLKLIEKVWQLSPLSGRSRDNLPNPAPSASPYVPANSPAIGDLTTMFNM
jgi:phospholipase C